MEIPASIYRERPGTCLTILDRTRLAIVIREDAFRLAHYPRDCPVELRLPVWSRPPVTLAALLLRVARSDLHTFDRWLDGAQAADQRMIQALSRQDSLEVAAVAEREKRAFTVQNTLQAATATLLEVVRAEGSWTREQFSAGRAEIERLYPSASALWWAETEIAPRAGQATARRGH